MLNGCRMKVNNLITSNVNALKPGYNTSLVWNINVIKLKTQWSPKQNTEDKQKIGRLYMCHNVTYDY